MRRVAREPSEEARPAAPAPERTAPIGLTAEQLIIRGLVPAEKREELQRFLEARKSFESLFGREPPADREDRRPRLRRSLSNVSEEAKDFIRRLEAILDSVRERGLLHLDELLKNEPERLKRVRALHERARRTVEAALEVTERLPEQARPIEDAVEASELLERELLELRKQLCT